MMIEQDSQSAPPELTGWVGGFAPGQTAAEPLFTPETPAEPVAEKAAEAPKVEAKPEEETPLSKLIRAQREEREARQAADKRKADAEQRATELEATVAKLKAQDDPMKDPGGWARSRNMTPEQQLLFASSLIYDVRPEKAPEGLRFQLFEQRQAREKAAEEAARQTAAEKAAAEAHNQKINAYVTDLSSAAKVFDEGSFPESKAWFDTDHDNYVRSLFATANNMAEAAQRAGRVADLSPSNVAKVLEADVAARMSRRDAKRGGAVKKQEPAVKAAVVPQQGTGETVSTKGLGAGAPRGPAMSEEERIRRASEVAFRSK